MEGEEEAEVSDEDESADSGHSTHNVNNNNNNNNNESSGSGVGSGGGGGGDSQALEGGRQEKKHKIKLSPALSRLTSMKSVSFKDPDQAASVGVLLGMPGLWSVCMPVCLSVYQPAHACLSVCLSASSMPVSLFVYLPAHVCLCLPAHVCLSTSPGLSLAY